MLNILSEIEEIVKETQEDQGSINYPEKGINITYDKGTIRIQYIRSQLKGGYKIPQAGKAMTLRKIGIKKYKIRKKKKPLKK